MCLFLVPFAIAYPIAILDKRGLFATAVQIEGACIFCHFSCC